MSRDYSDHYLEKTRASTGDTSVYLMEITHPQLEATVRLTNDTADIESDGNTFTACAFRMKFPEDVAAVMPRIPVSIDNIGRELTQWLEASNGGRGASFRIMEIMRDTPDVVEQEFTMKLIRARQNVIEVSGELGYDNVMDLPGLAEEYTPETTPSLF